MLVYPRAELLALRKLPHVAERGPEERTGDVVPDGMPQLGEGIGSLCLWDPTRQRAHDVSSGPRHDHYGAHRPARGGIQRYGSHIRGGDDPDAMDERKAGGLRKFEVSPTNRYYGLPVDGATVVPLEPRTRERKGGLTGLGKDAGDLGGGQMGSFQIQSRTGLGLGVGGGVGGRRGDRQAGEDGTQGTAGSRLRRPQGGDTTTTKDPYRPFGKVEQAEWRRGKAPPGLGDRARPVSGAERRYVTGGAEGRRQYGGSRVEEEEGTPEWMMDDEVPSAISGIGLGRTSLESPHAAQPLQDASAEASSAGFARFAGGEGVDGIAAYRKEMQARERRMRGLPAEDQVVAPTLQDRQEDVEEISFLLPTARKVQTTTTIATASNTTVVVELTTTNPAAAAGRASRFTRHIETPTLNQANIAPTPTKAETDAKEKTALLAGILGINPSHGNTMSPAFASSPLHQRASPAQSSPHPHPGMPQFFSGPPPPGLSVVQAQSRTPPIGQGDDHMSRLLNMLKSGGSDSSSAAATPMLSQATSSPLPSSNLVKPFEAEQTSVQRMPEDAMQQTIQSAGGAGGFAGSLSASGSIGRESRFFGRHSGTTSSAQSPVESPIQSKSRPSDGQGEQGPLRWNKSEPAGTSPTQRTKQPAPSLVPEEARSPLDQQAQAMPPPPGVFSDPPVTQSPIFRQGQPMPPPGMDMTSSPMRPGRPLSDQENQLRSQGVFSTTGPGAMPPPFWQGGPPGAQQFPPPPLPLPLPYGGMPMHIHGPQHHHGYNPNQGFPPPPPGMQGHQGMMLPHHRSPAFGPAYPLAGLAGVQHHNPGTGLPAPGYPYTMPPPGQIPPYAGPGGMPPPPPPTQSHGQMTNDLMNMLGSMQARNQEPQR
ncbi:hypothetical protein NliqN6_2756 [Naganishia liquefaciens]|uniref:Uncharacterized protein n=1 Tax=Naganishia liquefaciens TaxID=104408 RepID=A0A8H3TSR3_9TREE|nr:hypothetical protein NliqN6_2756 [Naganishia liquefaciens]